MPYRSPTQPLCAFCGGPIPKHTEWKNLNPGYLGGKPLDEQVEAWAALPATKAEAQARFNEVVTAVRYTERKVSLYSDEPHPNFPRRITEVHLWDGESYVDPFFCKGPCRNDFAYEMARQLKAQGRLG